MRIDYVTYGQDVITLAFYEHDGVSKHSRILGRHDENYVRTELERRRKLANAS